MKNTAYKNFSIKAMNNEIWKPIEGYEGIYSVSNYGRVLSETRIDDAGRLRRAKIMKSNSHDLTDKGFRVRLTKNGHGENVYIKNLVVNAFLDKTKYYIHKNGNEADNSVANLIELK